MSGRRTVSWWLVFAVWAVLAAMLVVAVQGAIAALTMVLDVIA